MTAPDLRYPPPARALHSLVAIGIVAALVLALLVPDGNSTPEKVAAVNLHRWLGAAVLALVVLRVLWRLFRRPPALPANFGRRERFVTHAGHGLLYLLMAAVPVLGWLLSGAMGLDPVTVGGASLPDLVARQPREVEGSIHEVHELAAWALVVLAGLHGAIAVKHHVADRNGFLRRMF